MCADFSQKTLTTLTLSSLQLIYNMVRLMLLTELTMAQPTNPFFMPNVDLCFFNSIVFFKLQQDEVQRATIQMVNHLLYLKVYNKKSLR